MSLHPTLQPYADAWNHSVEAISELVQPLVEADWNRRTPCPGWSVRDVVSHVIGLDCEMLGDPRPIHALPRDLFHVTDDHQRYMEIQVDVRRHHTAPEMTSELEYTIIRRNRQLRNDTREPGRTVRGPLGSELTLEESMRRHAFDVWVHEQDLRAALGRPGNLDSPRRARRPRRAARGAAAGGRRGCPGTAQLGRGDRRPRARGVPAHRPRRHPGAAARWRPPRRSARPSPSPSTGRRTSVWRAAG
ncbi:maleylpyruvate isomerase family mycothiol-dependent enzyme [Streptomyces prasinus]|uniref:maleylpyruvate isomerase family mycothiol-dependent enzyme n=1 Tax=Streptomyces prasinus TaxID=67345 RepID=UPI002F3E95C3